MTQQEARQRWIDNLQGFLEEKDIQLPVQEMPTLCELEVAFRRVSIGKAIGIDEVPPDLCHFCPVQLAKICYPMLLKAALFGQEAHEHKGGKLAIAWKKRGDVRDCHTHTDRSSFPVTSAKQFTEHYARNLTICMMLTCKDSS